MLTVVEDPEGTHAIRLALYNYTSCKFTDDLTQVLPIGIILVIKNPWFKSTMDGGYTLRCDNPAEVLIMEEAIFHKIFPNLSWNGSIPKQFEYIQKEMLKTATGLEKAKEKRIHSGNKLNTTDNSKKSTSSLSENAAKQISSKKTGNEHFIKGEYLPALIMYSACIDWLGDSITDDLDLLSNRAAVFLKLAWFPPALTDTENVLKHDPCHIKAIYRKSKALCGLNRHTDAIAFVKSQLGRFPKSSENYVIISSELEIINAMKEQLLGNYNMFDLHSKIHVRTRLENMLEFKGPIEIAQIPGKGRGMIATKNIKAGNLLLASRAFAIVYTDDDESSGFSNMSITIKIKEGNLFHHPESHKRIVSLLLQLAIHDPQSKVDICRLFAGPKMGYLELDGNSDCGPERIEEIINHNAFSIDENEKCERNSFTKNDPSLNVGLWLEPSLINHSCLDSNCFPSTFADFMFIRAAKDIAKGEEILINYASPRKSFNVRTNILKNGFNFVCNCSLCILNKNETSDNVKIVEEIMIKEIYLRKKSELDENDVEWLNESIATMKRIRPNEKLNLDLVLLYNLLSYYYFKNGNLKMAVEENKKAHMILEKTILINDLITIDYNIVSVYLLMGGKQNLRRARQWTVKMKENFFIAHGTLDVLRNKEGWKIAPNFGSLLKQNGIEL